MNKTALTAAVNSENTLVVWVPYSSADHRGDSLTNQTVKHDLVLIGI